MGSMSWAREEIGPGLKGKSPQLSVGLERGNWMCPQFSAGFKVLMRWHGCLPVERSRIEDTSGLPGPGFSTPCNSPIEINNQALQDTGVLP